MADEEQFSLCWNNFNTNLSAGFHESLCRGDLVDVTLCAEGQLVRAHRLVLSVCSPYFRKMFTQMPANQHAFIFMKDVSHTVLKDLIQFMYCGEVNVKQDALPTFISTAEALQIKGLTETGESAAPSVTPHPLPSSAINAASAAAASAAPASAAAVPAKVAPAAAATTTTVVAQSSNTVTATTRNASPTRQQQQQQSAQASQQQARYVQRQRQATTSITSNTSSNYKLDSEDSSDERVIIATQQQHQQQTHKRTQQQRGSLSHQQQNVAKRQRHISNAQEQAHSAAAVEPSATVVHVQQQQQQQQIVQVQVHQPQQQAIIAAVQLKDHDASSSLADAEFIDLPIEMAAANTSGGSAVVVSAKSEPDYEELGDVETIEQEQDQEMAEEEEEEAEDEEHDHQQHHEQQLHHHHEQQEHEQEEEHDDEQQQVAEGEEEATYVEDDQYGDMKYDESYFTENDESKAGGGASGGQSGYDDSYAAQEAADASGTEAQANAVPIVITAAPNHPPKPQVHYIQYVDRSVKIEPVLRARTVITAAVADDDEVEEGDIAAMQMFNNTIQHLEDVGDEEVEDHEDGSERRAVESSNIDPLKFEGDNDGVNAKPTIVTSRPPGVVEAVAESLSFIRSQRGAPLLVNDGYVYRCERKSATRTYWLCVGYKRFKCNARIICDGNRHVKRTRHCGHDADRVRLSKANHLEFHSMEAPDRDEFLNSVQK